LPNIAKALWEPVAEKESKLMDVQAVIALVVGTVLVLCIPALMLSPDIVDRLRSALRR
jgi:hypothetical protein